MYDAGAMRRAFDLLRERAPWLAVAIASYAYRLPALLGAGTTNSDAAIVGLQAMHVLRGEWSPFLFGSGYQTSFDSFVAALFFAVLGATPLALMLSSLTLHVALTGLAFATLARHAPRWTAAILVAPLVLSSSVVHGYALYPPRQLALTLAFAAAWTIDGASRARRPAARFCAGGAVAALACCADPYALLLLPLTALLAALSSRDGEASWRTSARRLGAAALGGAAGIAPLVALLASPHAVTGETRLTTETIPHNAKLLVDVCFPWVMSARVYYAHHMADWGPWDAPAPVRALQIAGAVIAIGGMLYGGAAVAMRSTPWPLRRLGLVGFAALPLTVAAFLLSVMVMDLFSTRYLVAIPLYLPFALAPLAARLRPTILAGLLAPHVVASALSGWMGYAPAVDGAAIRTGLVDDDVRLGAALRERGVHHAIADYWASYRLTLLYREDPIVVPSHAAQDRYAPYRAAVASAPAYAYIVDASRSEEPAAAVEARVRAEGAGDVERITVGSFTAFIVRAAPSGAIVAR